MLEYIVYEVSWVVTQLQTEASHKHVVFGCMYF
jgi:hypothetical protein